MIQNNDVIDEMLLIRIFVFFRLFPATGQHLTLTLQSKGQQKNGESFDTWIEKNVHSRSKISMSPTFVCYGIVALNKTRIKLNQTKSCWIYSNRIIFAKLICKIKNNLVAPYFSQKMLCCRKAFYFKICFDSVTIDAKMAWLPGPFKTGGHFGTCRTLYLTIVSI